MTFEIDDVNAEFFSAWLKKMDEDVAVAFVLSGISLNKEKMLEAFDTACQVMHIRALERAEKLRKTLGLDDIEDATLSLDVSPKTTEEEEDTKDFVSRMDKLIKGALESDSKKKDPEEEK